MKDYLGDIIGAFVAKGKRERLRFLLSKPKRRADLLDELFHDPRHFDPRCVTDISACSDEAALAEFRRHGASSEVVAYDSFEFVKVMRTEDAFREKDEWSEDLILYCWSSRVAYYEGHEGWRYILTDAAV